MRISKISALKDKLEENYRRQLKQLEIEHADAIEVLQHKMAEQHQNEMEEEYKKQEEEVMELESQLEKEKNSRTSETGHLQDQITLLKNTIEGLHSSINKSNDQIQVEIRDFLP